MELAKETPMLCLDCSSSSSELEWIASWGEYRSGIERLIHAFKFERHDFLGDPLGELLAEAFRKRTDDDFDCVVAVPMHPKKIRRRGYNQAELLARSLARRVRLPLRRDLLRKVRETSMQSTLPREERAENVKRAFTAGPRAKGLGVLLVDDICTTGETLHACGRELIRQGARRVCALTVARA